MSNKFRKKPVVITADRWFKNGDHPFDYPMGFNNPEHEGKIVRRYRASNNDGGRCCLRCDSIIMHKHGWIDTLEGGYVVCPGDWIITGVNGEYYPCKHDIFKKTYEPAPGGVLETPIDKSSAASEAKNEQTTAQD